MRIDPRAIRDRPWAPPALVGICFVVLASLDHSGVGLTIRLNLYVVPALAAAVGVLALAMAWTDRAARAVPDAIGPGLLSFMAGLAGTAGGDVLGSATGTWVYTETASLFTLLVVVTWAAPLWGAVPTAVLLLAAVTLIPARFDPIVDSDHLAPACLLWDLGAVVAGGFGAWLRARDAKRTRTPAER
ncbi:hypothetical protein [Streptomyces sp. SID3343]|uniref:hypothetical protein n=1 Tax=Streptomyces sp. SID3343 TaxID=2690260 RepID=UPI00136AAA89|nr:hypothetical protein [Streptomyces sp. SID3343]MYV96949.1 hypothetical protein [Streptomyces sp. SID3343]